MAVCKRTLMLTALALFALSCTEKPKQQLVGPGAVGITPRAGVTTSANGIGACMGEDALASGFTSGLGSSTALNCTANDISIAFAQVVKFRIGGVGTFDTLAAGQRITCLVGDTVYAITNAFLQNNAQQRYDIGVWIAVDGGDAVTGSCAQFNLIPGQFGALSLEPSPNGDQCGDMAQSAALVTVPLDTLKLVCQPVDSVSVGACLGWENSDDTNQRGLCPTTPPGGALGFRYGTVPETKSKCNCQPFFLPIDVRGQITIVKNVVGGNGTFSFTQDVGSNSNPVVATPFFITTVGGTGTQQILSVKSGTYHVAEQAPPAGFAFDSAKCTAGGAVTGQTATITLATGAHVTCTYYNHKQPKLTLVKRIVNDNGGTAVVGDFAITSTAGALNFDAGVPDGASTTKYTSNTLTVAPGAYTLHEGTLSGYTEGTWSCTAGSVTNSTPASGSVTLAAGDSAVCTITNNDQGSTLKFVKTIINDNGGTKGIADFALVTSAGALTFNCVPSGTTSTCTSNTLNVNAGSYTFSESAVVGYAAGTWSCSPTAASGTAFNAGSVTIGLDVSETCSITNNDLPGALKLVKNIVNDNGGAKVVADFGITTTAGALTFGAPVVSGSTSTYTSNLLTVNAGTYSLHEGTVTGYAEGSWSCSKGLVSGDAQAGSVAVGNADTITCTITNNDLPGVLKLVKNVVNDNGGTAVVGDFGISTTAGALTFGAPVVSGSTSTYTSNALTVNAATYSLHENTLAGYTEGSWSCNKGLVSGNAQTGSVAVGNADTITCTITNNDVGSTLKLVKVIVNDNGGTKGVADFGLVTSAGALTFNCVPSGTTTTCTSNTLNVNAGAYTFSENDVAGYTEGTWSCSPTAASGSAFNAGSVTIGLAVDETCTITNNDQQGSLTLVKRITNQFGGTANVGTFGITTTAGALTFGAGAPDGANTLKYTSNTLPVNAGSYNFSELDVAGYAEGTWSCSPTAATGTAFNGGSVTVGNGVAVTCTITNQDQQGSLTLVKRIVNDNGGTKVVADFGITTTAGALTFGAGAPDGANTLKYTSNTLPVNAGSYNFSELDVAGYTEGTWSCSPTAASGTAFNAGSVTIANGVAVTCTITNNDQQGSLTLIKRIRNAFGGTKVVGDFGITTTAGALTFGAGVPSSDTTVYTSNTLPVNAGSYNFSELNVAGYTEGTWSCKPTAASGTAFNAGSVTVGNGIAVTCEITNVDQPATLIVVKTVKGAPTTFNFAGTGAGVPASFSLTPLTTDGSAQVTYTPIAAGTKTITETVPNGYVLTDLGCSDQPAGTYDPTVTQTVSTTIPNGGTVTCTFVNEAVAKTTRTQGFWATHLALTHAVWFGGTVGGNTFTGVTDKTFCAGPAKDLNTDGRLMGGFWSGISQTSTKTKRSSLDQARMQLMQQLLAAILNNAAFGSAPSGTISIADARAAYCTDNETAIKAAMTAMANFNTSGDTGVFTPGISANGKTAKDAANLPYWDVLP